MKREFKDCPICGEKDGLMTITSQDDMMITKKIFKSDTCTYQPKIGLQDSNKKRLVPFEISLLTTL